MLHIKTFQNIKTKTKIATRFRLRLKHFDQILNLHTSEVPIHYLEKLIKFLKELERHNNIQQIGSSPGDKPNYGTTYSNPSLKHPKVTLCNVF